MAACSSATWRAIHNAGPARPSSTALERPIPLDAPVTTMAQPASTADIDYCVLLRGGYAQGLIRGSQSSIDRRLCHLLADDI